MELFAADGHDAGGCERVTGKSGMRPILLGASVFVLFIACLNAAGLSLALPVPHNFLLDFMRPLRYGGQHGDSESGLT